MKYRLFVSLKDPVRKASFTFNSEAEARKVATEYRSKGWSARIYKISTED